jgi:Tol biopolymer transport system component
MNFRPSISADGSKMAYVSNRKGNFDVWLKDLVSGNETALTNTAKAEVFATISRDASQVAFWDGASIQAVSTSGGAPRLVCEKCGRPDDWSLDGKLIISPGLELNLIGVRDPLTSSFTKIAAHPTLRTTAPHLSPDGKWIVFHTAEEVKSSERLVQGKRQIFIAPYTGQWIPPSNWIPVTDGTAMDREAKWSADGNQIYFLSDRDRFRCIWARKLDVKTKRPIGSIYPVLHLHNTQLSFLHVPNTGNVSLCPVGDKLIFAIGELTGNLWMTDLRQN